MKATLLARPSAGRLCRRATATSRVLLASSGGAGGKRGLTQPRWPSLLVSCRELIVNAVRPLAALPPFASL